MVESLDSGEPYAFDRLILTELSGAILAPGGVLTVGIVWTQFLGSYFLWNEPSSFRIPSD